jgi:hypothetical protein
MQASLGALALGLALSNPRPPLGGLGLLRTLSGLLTMLGDRLLAPLLELSLLGAMSRPSADSRKHGHEQADDEYRNDDDRDQYSRGHTAAPPLFAWPKEASSR